MKIHAPALSNPRFSAALEPSIGPIEAVHRAADSVVVLTREEGDRMPLLRASTLADLRVVFPAFLEDLARDSFYGINGRSPDFLAHRAKRGATGGQRDLAYLCACYLDFDVGRQADDLDFAAASARVLSLVADGHFAPPSLLIDSGRGCWALWLLRDDDDETRPAPANAASLELHRRVQLRLRQVAVDNAPELRTDSRCVDAARMTRVPGSINGKSGRAVAYYAGFDGENTPTTYTLRELAGTVDLEEAGHHRRVAKRLVRSPVNAEVRQAKQSGWRGRWVKLRDSLLELERMRGGFRAETRNRAMLYLARSLRCLGVTFGDALSQVEEVAARCRSKDGMRPHPASIREAGRSVGQAFEKDRSPWGRFPSWATVAADLAVSDLELEALKSMGLGPKAMPGDAFAGETAGQRRETRRGVIRAAWDELEILGLRAPPLRQLQAQIEDMTGQRPALGTLRTDLASLGLSTGRERRPAPRLPL